VRLSKEEMNKKTLRYLKDDPILSKEQDKLNFDYLINTIQDILTNSESPINIGLFGKWGVGKSSILNLLDERLRNVTDMKFIIIDTWLLSQEYLKQEFLLEINHRCNAFAEEDLLDKLIRAREEERVENEKIGSKQKIWRFLKKGSIPLIIFFISAGLLLYKHDFDKSNTGDLTSWILALSTSFAGIGALLLPSMEKLIDKLESISTSTRNEVKSKWIVPPPELSYQFQEVFKDIQRRATGQQKSSLVIALDNLDRCDPKKRSRNIVHN
jgi:Cdc6-like AAA superfamily ATPase